MRALFDPEGKVIAFCSRVAQLMLLNVMFLVSCIPIVTVGAAVTALQGMCGRLLEDRDGNLISNYFRLFRQNFRQATLLWLLMLVSGLLLGEYIYLAFFSRMTVTIAGVPLALMMMPVAIFLTLAWLMIVLWCFVLQCYFENTLRRTLTNAFLVAVLHLPRTVINLVVLGVCVLTPITVPATLFFWVLLGFAFFAYLTSALNRKVVAQLERSSDNAQK